MSMHKSLRNKSKNFRSVRKKWERVEKLKKDDKLKGIFKLSKEKIIRMKKQKKKEEEVKNEMDTTQSGSVLSN